ncbi:hypothetical protein ACFX2A_005212 [Malus domestica]
MAATRMLHQQIPRGQEARGRSREAGGGCHAEIQDVEGVELCGTLKNVVAIAAGFVDGLEMGNNTKAAIMRIGLREMKAFSKMLFSSIEMARGSSKKGAMLPPRPPMR